MPEIRTVTTRHILPPGTPREVLDDVDIDEKSKKFKKTTECSAQELFEKIPFHKQRALPGTAALNHSFTLSFVKEHPEWFTNTYKFEENNLKVGVEVEVENVTRIDAQIPLCFWQIAEDGSLRNSGREFKTFPTPLMFIEGALTQLFSGLNKDVDFSRRTSIHVHVDARQLTPSQIIGFTYLYAVFENLLFKFAENTRRNSIFCVPIIETDLLNLIGQDPMKNFWHVPQSWQKYSALNLKALFRFGTIEFRHMPGTNHIHKLLVWMDMLSRLRRYVYKFSLNELVDKIAGLNSTSEYDKLLNDVFGELSVYLDTSNLLMDMEKAVYAIKMAQFRNAYHSDVLKSISADSHLFSFYPKNITMPPELKRMYFFIFKLFLNSYRNESTKVKYRQIIKFQKDLQSLVMQNWAYHDDFASEQEAVNLFKQLIVFIKDSSPSCAAS